MVADLDEGRGFLPPLAVADALRSVLLEDEWQRGGIPELEQRPGERDQQQGLACRSGRVARPVAMGL